MKDLQINNTPKTPEVNFNLKSGVFSISGVSVPENSMEFYETIINYLTEYVSSSSSKMKFVFKLSYVNTSSIQFIYDILMISNEANNKFKNIEVDWYYMKDDDDMMQMGEDFNDAVGIDFSFTEVESI